MKVKKILLGLCLLAPLVASANCNLSIGSLAFGSYNPFLNSDVLSSASMNVQCMEDKSFTIKIKPQASGELYREMKNVSNPNSNTTLKYGIYLDVGRTSLWADGSGYTSFYSGSGLTNNLVMYGVLYRLQNVYKGTYSDAINIEIAY